MRMAGARHWVLVGLSPAVLTLIHQSAACCRTSSRRRALRDDEGRAVEKFYVPGNASPAGTEMFAKGELG